MLIVLVALYFAVFMYSGRLRPATRKSPELLTKRDAERPMAIVTAKYSATRTISIGESLL